MPLKRHSAIAHAAYHDLRQSLLDESVSMLRGTPTRVERQGRAYWYDSFRIGAAVSKRYIGEDTPELRARLERMAALRADATERAAARARLIRVLRAEGFMGVDAATGSLLAAFEKSGLFRLGGTIVGTQAFRLYEGELGLRFGFDEAAQTADIDIISFERLSVALDEVTEPPAGEVLAGFDFAPVPSLHPAKVWRWRQTRGDLLVEFLTPSFKAEEDIVTLPAFGVQAQALHFLNYLIAGPIAAAIPYRNGVLAQIPRPERFAIHKLIVAERRSRAGEAPKAVKDRMQARFLIKALAVDRPNDLAEAWRDAQDSGPAWRQALATSLAAMPDVAELLATVTA